MPGVRTAKAIFDDREAHVTFGPPATLELISAAISADPAHKYTATFKHDGPPKVRKRLQALDGGSPQPHDHHH